MKNFYSFVFITLLISTSLLSALFPYPFFSHTGSISPVHQSLINDKVELEALQINSKNSLSKILPLDWPLVNNIFDKFLTVEVKDVKSGISFNITRVGGINHADIETADEESTTTFLNIIENFSFERRPTLVNIKGFWIPASICCKPHGYSLVNDNKIEGHFCLYFLGSKTENNKEDILHKQAIKFALKHGKNILQNIF